MAIGKLLRLAQVLWVNLGFKNTVAVFVLSIKGDRLFKKIIFLFLLFLVPLSSFALRINNPSIKLQLSPEDNYSGTIIVENPSVDEVSVKVYLEDFIYVAPFDGAKEFYALGATDSSLLGWISFSPQEFVLQPFSHRRVNFSISPASSFNSVHCGVLFFETSIGTTHKHGKAINVLGRIGSLIFVEAQDKKKQATFTDIQGSYYSLIGDFINSGNTFLHARGTSYVLDDEGIVKDRSALKELYFLPRDSTKLQIALSNDLAPGTYTMVITFDLADDDSLIKEVDFSFSRSGKVSVLDVRN